MAVYKGEVYLDRLLYHYCLSASIIYLSYWRVTTQYSQLRDPK